MTTDARSDLERRFDAGPLNEAELVKLVRILKKERDCWVSNANGLQKQVTALEDGANKVGVIVRDTMVNLTSTFNQILTLAPPPQCSALPTAQDVQAIYDARKLPWR